MNERPKLGSEQGSLNVHLWVRRPAAVSCGKQASLSAMKGDHK
jgi:hypothetical protein